MVAPAPVHLVKPSVEAVNVRAAVIGSVAPNAVSSQCDRMRLEAALGFDSELIDKLTNRGAA